MTIAAAVDILGEDQEVLIATAATFAQQRCDPCFMISVVGEISEDQREVAERNLSLITARNAAPVILQEQSDIAHTLATAAQTFGAGTLFVQHGRRRFGRRSLAEQIVHLRPPFQVVVVHPSSWSRMSADAEAH